MIKFKIKRNFKNSKVCDLPVGTPFFDADVDRYYIRTNSTSRPAFCLKTYELIYISFDKCVVPCTFDIDVTFHTESN